MKRPFLILTLLFIAFVLFNFTKFLDNAWFYASGNVLGLTIKNAWGFAALNIAVFLALIFFIGRKSADWKTHGIFSAFIVSLFIEMYGAPLSLYLIATQFSDTKIPDHQILFHLDLFGINLAFDFWMTFGAFVISIGIAIIAIGWYQLWSSKKPLYTEGFYSYSRHPQYVGFLYVVWGWMIAWPTLLTILMAPVLTYAYINAAKKEEESISKEHKDYLEYKNKTPFLL